MHHNTQDFSEYNLQMGLYPAIICPTRITKSSAMLIDNIFVSSDLYSMCKSWILIDSTSDHFPCVLTVSGVKHKLKDPIRIESHDLSELDRLKTSLMSHDWNYIQDTLIDTNDACDRFFKDLTEQIEHFVPITSKTIPYAKLRREAWLTNGILKSIQKEKRLYCQMIRKSRLPVETVLPVETQYKTYKTILQQVKHAAKQSYYYERCRQFKHNTKKLWETMNAAINKNSPIKG